MFSTTQAIRLAILGVLAYFVVDWIQDEPRVCPRPDGSKHNILQKPQCSFSSSYFAARALFRQKAQRAGATRLETLVVDEKDDLTIDLAVFEGNPERLVLHLSATHGVEGFVGSAIQIAALGLQIQDQTFLAHDSRPEDRPTVIFVHAMNPYGFSNLRRWNEDGIDLNRNAMDEKAWEKARTRDPNFAGYEDFDSMLNPETEPSQVGWFINVLPIFPKLVTDFVAIKRAVVSGTYTKPGALFYGGNELAKSHKLFMGWLKTNGYTTSTKHLALIDVHTGLGPRGVDSIMFRTHSNNLISSLFQNETNFKFTKQSPIIDFESGARDAKASAGYDDVLGDTKVGYVNLFKNIEPETLIAITQEFGTINSILVTKALIQENQAFKTIPESEREGGTYWSSALLDAFNVRRHSFQESVVGRGVEVLHSSFHHIMRCSVNSGN